MKNLKIRVYYFRGDINYIDVKTINNKENEIIFISGTPRLNNIDLLSNEQKLLLSDIIERSDNQRMILCLTDNIRTVFNIPHMYHKLLVRHIIEKLRLIQN